MHQVTHLVGSYPMGFYMFYNNKYLSNFNNENIDIRKKRVLLNRRRPQAVNTCGAVNTSGQAHSLCLP